ncbi:MAG: hypothetical protein H6739_35045 [Alphaproteobacteria bacterium]|nr:hypothetical protein [Alphaproteobacteria bacterium]
MLLLALWACADPVAPTDSPQPVDSAAPTKGDWPDPIRRIGTIEVDNEGMELTDAVRAGDRLALLGQQQQARGGVWLFDIAEPAAPAFLGRTELWHVQSGCWSGQLLWGVDRDHTLSAFDISGSEPQRRSTWTIGGPDGDVDCAGEWVAWGRGRSGGGLARVEAETILEQWPVDAEVVGVRLDGETLWTAATGELRSWRLTAEGPVALASVALEGACRDIAVAEGRLAVACGAAGVWVLDADPDNPAVLGHWQGYASARSVVLSGETMWVAGWTDLLAFSLTDAGEPVFIGAEAANSSVMAMAAGDDGFVWVADWRTPFMAQLDGGRAPEVRVEPRTVEAGGVTIVMNDGVEPLWLGEPDVGDLSAAVLQPGETARWRLPGDVAVDSTPRLPTDDPDEPEITVTVGALGGLVVGEPAPAFVEVDTDGTRWDLQALHGEVVFLGLFADG